jgi:hypothetical protein
VLQFCAQRAFLLETKTASSLSHGTRLKLPAA